MLLHTLSEEGTAGGIAYFILAVLIFGMIFVMFNPLVQQYTETINGQLESTSITPTQERYDTFATVLWFWWIWPVLLLVGFGIYLWKVSLEEQSGVV